MEAVFNKVIDKLDPVSIVLVLILYIGFKMYKDKDQQVAEMIKQISDVQATAVNSSVDRDNSCASGDYDDPQFNIRRSALRFDLNSEDEASSVSLYVYGYSLAESGVSVQQGSQGGTLGTADWDAFSGSEFDRVTSWNSSAYNQFDFDSAGVTAFNNVAGSGYLELMLREAQHDYDDVEPTGRGRNGMYYYDYTGTSYDPYLEYIVAISGGWRQQIFGVV